jgi:hypothetical protein
VVCLPAPAGKLGRSPLPLGATLFLTTWRASLSPDGVGLAASAVGGLLNRLESGDVPEARKSLGLSGISSSANRTLQKRSPLSSCVHTDEENGETAYLNASIPYRRRSWLQGEAGKRRLPELVAQGDEVERRNGGTLSRNKEMKQTEPVFGGPRCRNGVEVSVRRIRYVVATSVDGYVAGPKGEADRIVKDPEIDFRALLSSSTRFCSAAAHMRSRRAPALRRGRPARACMCFPARCDNAIIHERQSWPTSWRTH